MNKFASPKKPTVRLLALILAALSLAVSLFAEDDLCTELQEICVEVSDDARIECKSNCPGGADSDYDDQNQMDCFGECLYDHIDFVTIFCDNICVGGGEDEEEE